MGTAETPLYQRIIDVLELAGLAWLERVQSGNVRVRGGRMHLARKGTPDLLGYARDGRCVGLEVKAPNGKRRPGQKEWIERALARGVIAGFVESPAEAVNLVASEIARAAFARKGA